jgi:hypothetical protein
VQSVDKNQFDGQCCKQRHVDAVHTVSNVGLMGLSCNSMDALSLRCLHYGPIKLFLLMEWTHQHYNVYCMVPTTVCSLRNRPIKLKLLRAWTHHM